MMAEWQHMVTYNLVSISSGNGMLLHGTKPSPATLLTHHERYSMAFTWEGSIVETRPSSVCFFSMVGFPMLVGRHLCYNLYHVILLMMRRKFCLFLWVSTMTHIVISNGLYISLQRCHVLFYLTVLYTHTCDVSLTYVTCKCDFTSYFVRNEEI